MLLRVLVKNYAMESGSARKLIAFSITFLSFLKALARQGIWSAASTRENNFLMVCKGHF